MRLRRKLIVGGLVAVASLLVSSFIVEVALRYRAFYAAQRKLRTATEQGRVSLGSIKRSSGNEKIIFELKPNLKDVIFLDVPVSTNSLGFRGREIESKKPDGLVRIVGIGDSTMFGWGVREEETYLARLEEGLNRYCPERRWEVINTGVPGYNTVMEVETLRVKGLSLDPDVVVIELSSNDLNLPTLLHKKRDYFELDTLYIHDFVLERLGLLQPVTDLFVPVDRGDTNYQIFEQDPELVRPEYRDMVGWEPFERALDELATLSSGHGFEVVALTMWHHRIVKEMSMNAARRGFTTLSVIHGPRRALKGRDWAWEEGLKLSAEDPHPSAKMHGMAAEALFKSMEESGVLARVMGRDR